jgi:hypothetical protein
MTGTNERDMEIRTPLWVDAWLKNAVTGERLEYYRGYLSSDSRRIADYYARSKQGRRLSGPARDHLALLAAHVRDLMMEGAVVLMQKRHGALDYSYYCVKVSLYREMPVADPWRAMEI